MSIYKTVTATTLDDDKIRVRIPSEMYGETTAGHREYKTGIVLIAYKRGRKWTVVKTYSKWVKRDGSCYGFEYAAYRNGVDEIPAFSYSDTEY